MARDGERGRGDWKARPGSQNSGPYAEASGDTGPVDIAAVRRDDALIDAISGDGPVQTGTAEEYQLAALLANWRAEIVAEPMPAGPDLDTIVAAVNQEIGARTARINAHAGGRLRLVRPILGAAAAIALVIGGLTAFSYNAAPGDPLWRIKEVVFSEQAQTTVVARADGDLVEAQKLIEAGKPQEAAAVMERAQANASQVNDSGKKDDLLERWQALLVQLPPAVQATLSATTTPSTPSTGKPAVTTQPNVTVAPTAPTTGGNATPDPTIMGVTPEPGTGGPSTGGHTTVPTQPNTQPSQPATEPSEPSVPTGGPIVTTTAAVPTANPGTGTGGGQPATQPPVDQPTAGLPTMPATQPNTLPTAGITMPNFPAPGATR
ncbi:anti-sigma-D factor RsdA [Nocardia yamanashiensis]|uniref:anti-sigma-D factor RsdA n=1 Tax=Nocardia yamanashiensis TaxID=209247 RepID=UPI0009FBB208|nr:anti-sigma-D factor RsdA [Nocardia yamanashiensis]